MPIGIIINVIAVLLGTIIGGSIKKYVPDTLKKDLPKVFGICALTIGINSIIQVKTLPAVIMSVILGYIIGELLHIDTLIGNAFSKVLRKLSFGDHDETYIDMYLLVVLMFSMSGMGIFGALVEGMSGDTSVLISKSVLDLFTAILFGTTLGYAQGLICIPQFIILTACFLLAKLIMPFINETMIIDFKACGGLVTMITGLAVSRILDVKAIKLVPALIIVMPLVALFLVF